MIYIILIKMTVLIYCYRQSNEWCAFCCIFLFGPGNGSPSATNVVLFVVVVVLVLVVIRFSIP